MLTTGLATTGANLGVRRPAVKRIRRLHGDEHVGHLPGCQIAHYLRAELDTVGQVNLDADVLQGGIGGVFDHAIESQFERQSRPLAHRVIHLVKGEGCTRFLATFSTALVAGFAAGTVLTATFTTSAFTTSAVLATGLATTGANLGVRCSPVKRIRRLHGDEHVNHLAGRQIAQNHGAKLDTVGQVDFYADVLQGGIGGVFDHSVESQFECQLRPLAHRVIHLVKGEGRARFFATFSAPLAGAFATWAVLAAALSAVFAVLSTGAAAGDDDHDRQQNNKEQPRRSLVSHG
uniref:Uncharacterized protein n=1 Tax=Aplysina aerophoba bacterial symbiont clone pAE27P20 TaxID=377636 RepID=A4U8P1_9BACT|nr:hypothetical protein [Aplysina aerophoba bacterial symbiont clone pAE27P20]